MNDMITWGKQSGLKSFEQVMQWAHFHANASFMYLEQPVTSIHPLSNEKKITGEGHLLASGSIFGTEWTADADLQAETATDKELL